MTKDVPGRLALVPGSHCGNSAQYWQTPVLLAVPFGTAILMDLRLVHGGRAYAQGNVHHRLHFYVLPKRAAAPNDGKAQPAPLVFHMDTEKAPLLTL